MWADMCFRSPAGLDEQRGASLCRPGQAPWTRPPEARQDCQGTWGLRSGEGEASREGDAEGGTRERKEEKMLGWISWEESGTTPAAPGTAWEAASGLGRSTP